MIISQTPLRISFVGGGTDLPEYYHRKGGSVLSSAIDKYIYVVLKERFDDQIRVGYTKMELVSSVKELKHELVREALTKANIDKGVEIVTIGDIPSQGTGLGSSSTLTVGLLNACYQYISDPQHPLVLARDAYDIEREHLGNPVGKQDQYIAALGGLKKLIFHQDDTVSYHSINLSETALANLNRNTMLFYTGITRDANTILIHQQNNSRSNLQILDSMKNMVDELELELEKGNIDSLGEALHQNWSYKKQLADGITNNTIDELYQKAINAGALGGKITGAGGGGFLLFYTPTSAKENVRKALADLREVPFVFESDGTKTLLNARRPK